MSDKSDPSSRFIIMIVCLGVVSSSVVLFTLRLFSQRSEGDPFFASNDYLQFKQSVMIKNIRQEMAEEFVGTVVNCISPQILPGQSLTEQQLTERVTTVLENFSASNENIKNQKCEKDKSRAWTFALPCKLIINRPPIELSGMVKLGDINICGTTIAASIRSATGRCSESANFPACLVTSILANDDVKKEIDKPVEIEKINSQ
jgi:hypothetical protein